MFEYSQLPAGWGGAIAALVFAFTPAFRNWPRHRLRRPGAMCNAEHYA
jgi:hypothetical protein